jgi:hypothetical protein
MGSAGYGALAWIQGFSTVVIGAIAVYIAWRQHRTSEDNLRLSLSEKRFSVYAAFRDILSHLVTQADVTQNQLFDFLRRTNEAPFLFEKDVLDYSEVVYKKAVRVRFLNIRLHEENVPVGEERTALVNELTDLLKWATEQLTPLRTLFSPYIAFRVRTRGFGDPSAP